jgi:hypothetical protein
LRLITGLNEIRPCSQGILIATDFQNVPASR